MYSPGNPASMSIRGSDGAFDIEHHAYAHPPSTASHERTGEGDCSDQEGWRFQQAVSFRSAQLVRVLASRCDRSARALPYRGNREPELLRASVFSEIGFQR